MKEKESIKRQLAMESGAMSRRDLLKHMSVAGSAAALGSMGSRAYTASAPAEPPRIPVREAFETLTSVESETLEAMVSRILPSDENGPGAYEARAVHFIDRALAGPMSEDRAQYGVGLLALNEYAKATYAKDFHMLEASDQDTAISAMAAGELADYPAASAEFFSMVRTHTIEGTFSDPYYGGNRNFIGWDMLGYPGVRLGSTVEDVSKGSSLEPSRQSAYDMASYTKNPVRASESQNTAGGPGNGH